MHLVKFLTAGSCPSLRANSLKFCILQSSQEACSCAQPQLYGRAWERGFHSDFSGLHSRPSSCLSPRWALQEFWAWTGQKRWVAAGTLAQHANASAHSKHQTIVYRGPLSETLRKVKILSLTSCCLSVLSGPIITFLTASDLSFFMKGGVAASVILLSTSATAGLHWFLGPYVHKLTWKPGDQEMEVEVISWMATFERRTIQISDIGPPKTKRPFVTFVVKDKPYFVEPKRIPNKELLKLLTFNQRQGSQTESKLDGKYVGNH